MLLLGIDTSSQAAGAALVQDGAIVCEYTLNQKKTHSAHLLPMTEQMLSAAGFTLRDMDGFACGIGPGSFTGVRIAAATVKGFAQALDRPVVTADSLETLAFGCTPFCGLTVSVIFARADEVFCAAYRAGGGGPERPAILPSVMTIDMLLERLAGEPCLFVGDGAVLHRERICGALGDAAQFAGIRQNMLSAGNLALLCAKRAETAGWRRYDEIEPLYLRVSQAEREYQEKHGGENHDCNRL